MSGINTIRRLTDTDTARIEAAAVRFAARHGIRLYDEEGPAKRQIEAHCQRESDNDDWRLANLWQAAFCRALGFKPCADLTTAYGYVGTRCK